MEYILASKGARYIQYCFSFFEQNCSQKEKEKVEETEGSKIFKIEKFVQAHAPTYLWKTKRE
jgi:hypothetical protein